MITEQLTKREAKSDWKIIINGQLLIPIIRKFFAKFLIITTGV